MKSRFLSGKNSIVVLFIRGIVVLVLIYIVLEIWIRSDESYSFAKEAVINNPIIQERLGTIKSVSMGFLGHTLHYTGPVGEAHYKFTVRGSDSKGYVYMHLQRKTGIWNVVEANLIIDDEVETLIK